MNIKAFSIILITTWLFTLFLPWWGVFIPAIILGAWLFEKAFASFITGFLATGFAWFLQVLYIHIANDAILSTRVAELIGVQSPWVILLITFLIGAIPGSLGCLLGTLLKLNLRKEPADEVSLS